MNEQQHLELLEENRTLCRRLLSLTQAETPSTQAVLPKLNFPHCTVIVTPNEVNSKHGTGVLISKIFRNSQNIVSIRSRDGFSGEQHFGDHRIVLSNPALSRTQAFANVIELFSDRPIKQAVCIPYYPEEVLTAIALKDVYGMPLCTYIMDDNTLFGNGIPSELMEELLRKSDLRLVISSEMRRAYERHYRTKFWLLPPIVSSDLLHYSRWANSSIKQDSKIGILVGNVWGQSWLERLRDTVRDSGVQIHWYANCGATKVSWLNFNRQQLEQEGIFIYEPLPEPELATKLNEYSFAILPSGTLDADDDNKSVALLSLPSRVPLMLATAYIPIVVLGSPKTAAAQFVTQFQVGTVCNYNSAEFAQAIEFVTREESQVLIREKAAALADVFSDAGVAEWIWETLECGEPSDLRFERLVPQLETDGSYYIDPPPAEDIYDDFVPVHQSMQRLKRRGYIPDFVVDVGASTGIWSDTVHRSFPDARFILVEPLLSRYPQDMVEHHTNFEAVEALVSDQPGSAMLQVSADLYNSSLFSLNKFQCQETIEVEVTTLDAIAEQKALTGQGILKMDVQYAEHLVLAGATNFLKQVDIVIIELSLIKHREGTRTFLEMLELMDRLGFRYFDDAGEWRLPTNGTLHNKDGLFVKHDLFLYEI